MRDVTVTMLQKLRRGDAAEVGGKAANLGELLAAGFAVPPGFCLAVSVYRAASADVVTAGLERLTAELAAGAADDLVERSARTIRDAIDEVALPAPVLAALEDAYLQIRPVAGGVAVRSSATMEDSPGASFAGQYHTELNVRSFEALVRAVKRCWASVWQVHAIRYRDRQGLAQHDAGMAVVVQAMVCADASGVMFTLDPSASELPRIVIESSWGCGEGVVGGLVSPDRFDIRKSELAIERVTLATKQAMVACIADGVAVCDVPVARRTAASLTEAQAIALAATGRAIEAHFGGPQDVEWSVSGGQLVILQARPITRAMAAPSAPPRWESPIPGARWARMSICDSWLPMPLSPLFATTVFPALIDGWMKGWAGPASTHRSNPLLPDPMSGTINGYAYLRIDYPLNRYPLRTLRLILNWFRYYLGGLERRWRTEVCPRHVERIGVLTRLDPGELPSAEVLRIVAEVQALSGEYWGLVGGLAWYWNAGEWMLARLYGWLSGATDTPSPGYAPLLQGYMTRTAQAEIALHELAQPADSALHGGEPADDTAFHRRLQGYLQTYGHQVYDLDLVEPTPAEDPAVVLAALEAYRDGRASDPAERLRTLAKRRDELSARLAAGLRWSPVKRRLLEAVLRWNRHYGGVRDRVLFHFTIGWPVMRRCYLELGRRLVSAGTLDRADDVFFLTRHELEHDLAPHVAPASRRSDTIRERRALWEIQKRWSPPEQVPAHGRLYLGGIDITSLAFIRRLVKQDSVGKLQGSAVSPGRVTGCARTICSVQDFAKLKAGEILIAPYITPAWTSLLAIAGGVVTDAGGALSHGSIVAREYGIPAVMGTQHATKQIRDGQIITIDGDRGLVY